MQENNGKMEFFYQYKEGDGSVRLTLPPDASLDEAIEGFETFLVAAGYVFTGRLEINGNVLDAEKN
jgi:hypothetical protein